MLERYFPGLTDHQLGQFERLPQLYSEWNAKINVISRQDIDNLVERHILHSLAIAKAMPLINGAQVLDLGTGGGFPGVPLAILYPEVNFTLIDGTGKKIRVVQEISNDLGLLNVEARHIRAEELRKPFGFDFVVSRAVASLTQLLQWSERLIAKKHRHILPNGFLILKGGDLKAEIAALPGKGQDYTEVFPISKWFTEPYFEEKFVVYVQG